MKAVLFRVASLAAAAASVGAQTTDSDDGSSTSTATTACAAQNILDTCLSTTESYVSLCDTTDYMCLCDKYTAILTMNASLYATTSGNRTVSRSITSTSSSETTTTSEGVVKTADVTAAASSPTATEPTQSGNSAGERAVHAGGRLAALAGVIAYFL
ncbi:hypothetical protein F4813DRAFT_394867 [Daldinia decipiens]|uniref:uncharacterized protein n=1 Tax=Daldinia decipiens TaxID=326647 RepID=UPI0020C426AE|nr:uncharacterized protein F4813DRAFT_394867 [Daldinia decipiens]KAI1662717.1 hypothetical protein F4813DRAFT_394867 [Daldinia decipiens]